MVGKYKKLSHSNKPAKLQLELVKLEKIANDTIMLTIVFKITPILTS